MELVISIAANIVLGLVLLAIFAQLHPRDQARLASPEEALTLFRQHFPDASGTASVSADGLIALIALRPDSGIGLLHRNGRRWNARELLPEDLRAVHCLGDSIILRFADFGWPRIRFRFTHAEARTLWLARLSALTSRSAPEGHSAGAGHA
jgi:hypothetical protein